LQSKSSSSSSADGSGPRTVKAHLAYTFDVARALLDLRRRRQTLDVRLRDAVRRRDAALEALGAAARDAGGLTGRLADYDSTLAALESELGVLEQRLADARLAVTRGEDERRSALEALERRLADVRAEAAPREQALDELRESRAELERRIRALDSRRRGADSGARRFRAQLEDESADLGPERERIRAELAEAEREQAEAAAALDAAEADRRAQDAPLAACGEEVARLHDELASLQADRKRRAEELSEMIDELARAVRDCTRREEDARARHRSVLIDLGRETLAAPTEHAALAEPLDEAGEALARCDSLRTDRATLRATRDGIDLAPVWRTLLVTAGVALAAAVLIMVLT